MTMEFDDMKKIWDAQNNSALYIIDEQALHNRILSRKKSALHITNISELLIIIVNFGMGCFVAGMNYFTGSNGFFMYMVVAWMFGTALVLAVSRFRRIRSNGRFDRTMLGELHHALATATYQVEISHLMRWNMLPLGVLLLLSAWEEGKSFLGTGIILVCFFLAFFASAWEHKYYKNRKHELEVLKAKLESEPVGNAK